MKQFNKDNLPKQGENIQVSNNRKEWFSFDFLSFDGEMYWAIQDYGVACAYPFARPITKPEPQLYDRVVYTVDGSLEEGHILQLPNKLGAACIVKFDNLEEPEHFLLSAFLDNFKVIETGYHLVNIDKLIKDIEGMKHDTLTDQYSLGFYDGCDVIIRKIKNLTK